MGKTHVDHRVVVRDQSDKIIFDEARVSFPLAEAVFLGQKQKLQHGHVLTLQHGARIIDRAEIQ